MAAITVTFNGTAQDLADFCAAMNYQATLPDGTQNPVTQVQFFSNQAKALVTKQIVAYRQRTATITTPSF